MSTKKASPSKKGTKKLSADRTPARPVGVSEAIALKDQEQEADQEVIQIPIDLIDLDRNYRQFYDESAMKDFAAGIKAVGFIISPVTVRVVDKGRYRLVVGKRRYFGAKLAGLTHLPGVIRDLTDEQVEEVQLQENIQREDPHPMHEAECIRRMDARGLSTQDISLRLGKPATWVYSRQRLSRLIGDMQDMFLAGVFKLSQAHEIAELSPEAQQAFYERQCKNWKHQPPRLHNLSNILSSFKCDLSHVLFDLNDAELSPEAGACTGCQFNTAFKGLLIPDTEGIAMCTRRACFENKSTLQLTRTVTSVLTTEEPVALLIDGQLSDDFKAVLDTIPGTVDLPVYQVESITLIEQPEKPDIQEFQFEPEGSSGYQSWNEEYVVSGAGESEGSATNEEPSGEPEEETFDRAGFEAAEEEYAEAMASYQKEITNGKSLKGFFLSTEELKIIYYYPVSSGKRFVVKDGKTPKIQDLIAAKQDTPEILQAEIGRIQAREVRYKELDQEKIQKQVHTKLVESTTAENAVCSLTDEDRFAARWLIFHSVTYEVRNEVKAILGIEVGYKSKPKTVFEAISKMTDAQFAGLVRMALSGIPDSKSPTSVTGYFLKQVAVGAGVNTAAIEKKQQEKAQTRTDNQEIKIALYKKRIKRHQAKAAA